MWAKDRAISMGLARIIDQGPVTDGQTATLISGFRLDPSGFLDSTERMMYVIPDEWDRLDGLQPGAFTTDRGVLAMKFCSMDGGERPELLMVTDTGVFRLAGWTRQGGTSDAGVQEVLFWDLKTSGAGDSITPQNRNAFPPQLEQVGNRVYISFCDGSHPWVWDGGDRLLPLGYSNAPGLLDVQGPARRDEDSPNAGGFSVAGRIGYTNNTWTKINTMGTPNVAEVVGGIEHGRWNYWQCWENEAGGYSPMSPVGGQPSLRDQLADDTSADPQTFPDALRRRFWVRNIAVGPPGTTARILLRTYDLDHLPPGSFGEPRFLHRIGNNVSVEYIDDIPDGELGVEWAQRLPMPSAMFLRHFGGSLFMMRTYAHPSRVWWTEQGIGPGVLESVLEGHGRDIFPETGGITGSLGAVPPQGGSAAMVIVGKPTALHYITGEYPDWKFGTLSTAFGLAGPGVIRSCPDGTVVGYGNGTFWQFNPKDGQVRDIGQPIRELLKTVNENESHMGTSFTDRRYGETVFVLPVNDEDIPSYQFVWDYRSQGWRILTGVRARATADFPNGDLVLVSGYRDGEQTLWALGRGFPGQTFNTYPVAEYQTGWMSLSGLGPDLHDVANANDLIFMLKDSYVGTAEITGYVDWDGDTPIFGAALDEQLTLHGAEDDSVKFWGPTSSWEVTTVDTDDLGIWVTTPWRTVRPLTNRMAQSMPSHVVAQIRIKASRKKPVRLYTLDAFGPIVARAGGRTQQ